MAMSTHAMIILYPDPYIPKTPIKNAPATLPLSPTNIVQKTESKQ